jgi:cytochrome b6-f complex iron-sulfur subunit
MQEPQHQQSFSSRRRIIWAVILGTLAVLGVFAFTIARPLLRFFLPRKEDEPSTVFRIGYVSDFSIGVPTKFLDQYRVYVIRNTERLFVTYARCTHLGCTPTWKPTEHKFSCPCHSSSFCLGSQFDQEGKNCRGPAQRPLDRAHVELDRNGQIAVDTGRLYEWPKEGKNEFEDVGAYIEV